MYCMEVGRRGFRRRVRVDVQRKRVMVFSSQTSNRIKAFG